ncbi:glycoside hydrolase family 43 protein [Paenibacillus luteus]|uniref:glycoside hydrolase family 43 protein n=1 Tax=Paenibacillus luteus TaxID=2545753 RepID=UPI0011434C79|nr:glycoside hydrolase family 43 protein [Paenibacillus luteus]
MYLFSYFTTEEEKLFLAESQNGLDWELSNEGQPVFASSVGTGQLRDPHLIQDHESAFHLVWTDGWSSRSIGYARSKDLLTWEDEKLIPVMEHLEHTQNSWAPEVFFDSTVSAYRIIWSSTVGGAERNHRIWSTTTKDFQTFTESKLFFDPGYNVIDATVTDMGDSFFMLFKDERGSNEQGTAHKAMRSCWISKAGADRDLPEVGEISGLLTPPLTEGPSLYAIDAGGSKQWQMIFDGFHEHFYSAVSSRDLKTWTQADQQLKLPEGARHGSVLKVK